MTTQTTTTSANTSTVCACGPCGCAVDPETAIEKNGQLYCCEACANGHTDGTACGNSGCGCAS
jgi:metallothionein